VCRRHVRYSVSFPTPRLSLYHNFIFFRHSLLPLTPAPLTSFDNSLTPTSRLFSRFCSAIDDVVNYQSQRRLASNQSYIHHHLALTSDIIPS
jgi:hypothetical protein